MRSRASHRETERSSWVSASQVGGLNGDLPLGRIERLRYAARALVEIFAAVGERPRVPLGTVPVVTLPTTLRNLPSDGPSPYRLMQDLVAATLIPAVCPHRARILDVGCGNGWSVHHFRLADVRGEYQGIDVARDASWDDLERASDERLLCRFEVRDVSNLEGLGPFDFTYSSSSLEHFADPDAAMANLARVTAVEGIALHMVPGPFSFPLYLWHGYRRFSAGRLSALIERHGFECVALLRLGGLPSFLLHLGFITVPLLLRLGDFRYRFRGTYARLLHLALKLDARLPLPAIGFAIVARRRAEEAPAL